MESITSASERLPTSSRAAVVDAICAPATPFSISGVPFVRPSCSASVSEITDWLAPVSTTNGYGPNPFTRTGAVIRR